MERDARVRRFWNWLPHFRAIAESSHLPTAAKQVHVTPPALSRTLKLLEEDLGHALFHRKRGRLVLTGNGRRLLEAVRLAMRAVDDAERHLGGEEVRGGLAVATGGVSVPLVTDAFLTLRRRHPLLEPRLSTPRPNAVVEQLWSGELDVVIASFVRRDDGLQTQLLGMERSSIYCGPAHPLHGRRRLRLDELVTHPFTAPPALPDGTRPEGWPAEVPRKVGFEVDRIALGVEVCGRTDLLAVLPDALAEASPIPLFRLPIEGLIPDTPILAMRVASDRRAVIDELIDEVRARAPIPASGGDLDGL